MGKNKKTVLKSFDYLHCDDFAAYLMDMSRKGWHFKEWGAGLVFERGEPEEITYAVEVFIDGSEYTTRPEVETEEFAEYCEAAGWVLVDAKRKFCIFKKVKADAAEILTDEERLHNIGKEERKEVFRQLFMALWFCILQILQLSGSSFVNIVFSNDFLFIELLWFVLAFCALIRAIIFFAWKHNMRKQIAAGKKVHFGKNKNLLSWLQGKYSWLPFAIGIFYIMFSIATKQYVPVLYVVGILLPLIIMAYLIARIRPDAITNQIIQTIIPAVLFIVVLTVSLGFIFNSNEEASPIESVPLLYEDIEGEAGALGDVHFDSSSSILGSGLRCWLYYEEEHVYYQVYKSDYKWILDRIWNDEMERKYNQSGNEVTALWNAEEAIQNTRGDYLVRYPDAVLILNFAEDTVLSLDQALMVKTALYESR